MIRRILIPIFLIFSFVFSVLPAAAQSSPVVSELIVAYTFGDQIIIRGTISPEYRSVPVSIRLSFEGDAEKLTMSLENDKEGAFIFVHLVENRFVQAFSDVSFVFIVEQADGSLMESEPYSFFYADNRFQWRSLESWPFRVHWFEGDVAFGQRALDAASSALDRFRQVIPVDPDDWLDVYIYSTDEDYRFAQGQLGRRWAGGHAEPELDLVLTTVAPSVEAALELDRKIPHEVAHWLLYHYAGTGFENLPAWLNEGFSSNLEAFPNPDYEYVVSNARGADRLIPLTALCEVFPQQPEDALLAYAESSAVVRYIESAYGPAGLRALVDAYIAGAGCEQGPLTAPLGLSLASLDRDWQEGVQVVLAPTVSPAEDVAGASPSWLLVFAAVVIGPAFVLIGAAMKRGKSNV